MNMATKRPYVNPFPGLRSFDSNDANLFFGRESHVKKLRKKLSVSRFLAIIGSSGSGKSSLVKAGLVPSLDKYQLENTDLQGWHILIFKPGGEPIKNLVSAFTDYITKYTIGASSPEITANIESLLFDDFDGISKVFGMLSDKNVLLVIDQFEEIFRYQQKEATFKSDRDETVLFIEFLVRVIHQRTIPLYAALTMRSDYLDYCTNYNGLTEAINRGYFLLPKMNHAEIVLAINGPLETIGVDIKPSLVDRLLVDIGDKTDQLPVLQHSLMRTWEHWQTTKTAQQPIDEHDYESIGTMIDALSLHAEEIYQDIFDSKRKAVTEKLFKSLTILGAGDVGIINPTTLANIKKVTGAPEFLLLDVLDRFREAGTSFLSPSYTTPIHDASVIDLTHERIAFLWKRLKTWVDEESESARLYKNLSFSAGLYQQGKTGLWINPELQIGLRWLKENRPTKEWAMRYDPYFERAINYLEYSRSQYEFEMQSKEARHKKEVKRGRQFAVFLGIGSLLSLLFLVVSIILRTQAKQSEKESIEKEQIALAEQKKAEIQKREAISQKRIAQQQEEIAEAQKKLTEEQKLIAVSEQRKAENQRQEAVQAQQTANEQRIRAEDAKRDAENQRTRAVTAQNEAERRKDEAEKAKNEAEAQKRIADEARKDADQQKIKAIVRSIAIQSFQMPENTQDGLPALLALHANNLNVKNKGEVNNPEIFNALSKAAGSNAKVILRKHTDVVRSVALGTGTDANLFASGSEDATVKLWDVNAPNQTPRTYSRPKSTEGFRAVVFSQNGRKLLAGGAQGSILSWSVDQPAAAPTVVKGHKSPINSLLLTKDNSKLISVSADGNIRTWNVAGGGIDSVANARTGFDLFCAQLSPDGKKLVCGSKDKVVVFDLSDLKKVPGVYNYYGMGSRVTALAFSPDGKKILTGNVAGVIYLWSFENDKIIEHTGVSVVGRHNSSVSDIVFSPNGDLVATSSFDWSVHLFNYDEITRQQQPIVIADFPNWVTGVRFTKDSKTLIAYGADKTVRLWDINIRDLYNEALKKITRNLTIEEWNKYVGKDIEYAKILTEVK
ncbi:WD40 repeat domain-containing protein [Runella sp.]|uniref:WD40 repeat domain-containing protein n=1 Tax=Runella sp. TaxID=1960881 RepID=UPI00262BA386|nr:hypothetical protein [Runella sp.]